MIRKWGSESKEFGGISGMMEGWNLNAGILEYWKNGRMAKEAGFVRTTPCQGGQPASLMASSFARTTPRQDGVPRRPDDSDSQDQSLAGRRRASVFARVYPPLAAPQATRATPDEMAGKQRRGERRATKSLNLQSRKRARKNARKMEQWKDRRRR